MDSHEDYPIDRTSSLWDGLWHGRGPASSVRRGIANCAGITAGMAAALREISRIVDSLPAEERALEIHGLCDELVTMTDSVRASVDELRAHAGLPAPPRRIPGALARAWRWLRRRRG